MRNIILVHNLNNSRTRMLRDVILEEVVLNMVRNKPNILVYVLSQGASKTTVHRTFQDQFCPYHKTRVQRLMEDFSKLVTF